jgi:hypothetical protein
VSSVQKIPLDEIASGASIRCTVIDDVQYLSTRDFIMHMCAAQVDYAGQIWRNIPETQKSDLREFLTTFKYPGRGQALQPVITFPGAIKLAMFLPGENAKKNRSMMANIIARYFAGDPSLIKEIEANAISDAPIQSMARAAIPCDSETAEEEFNLKRKREELELLKLETEITVMERKSQIEMAQAYTEMCSNYAVDDHAKCVFKEAMLSTMQSKNNEKKPRKAICVNSPLFMSVESTSWPCTNPLVEKYTNLDDMEPDDVYDPVSLQKIHDPKELQQNVDSPKGLHESDLKLRILGFLYEGPRINSQSLSACKQVKEAYGIKKDGKQFLILVMYRENGVRPHRIWFVLYRLGLLARCFLLKKVSFYQTGAGPIKNDLILDTIKQPADDKWRWHI